MKAGPAYLRFILHFVRFVARRWRPGTLVATVHTSTSASSPNAASNPEESIMNVIKHMEAAFIVALSLAAAGSTALDSVKPAQATAPVLATTAGIPVVHVTAKRLTPVEKQQMLALERVRSRA
jgi:hypothetical protein